MIRSAGLVLAFLCLLVSPEILLEHKSIDVINYASLIADVHDYYKASCVVLLKSSNYNDPSAAGQMHSWFLEFSRRGIFSVAFSFSKLVNEIEKYYNRIPRPLFVVLLDSNESMDEFALATVKLRISFPMWLVLFTQQSDNPLKEFCQRPTGNLFHLIFSTEMLVHCYDDPILKEWYAQSDNRTRVSDLANWSPESGLVPFSKKPLYARRSDMFGEKMRVITKLNSVYVSLNNGVLKGFLGDVVMELCAVMNFTTEIGEPFKEYGNWHKEEGAWKGGISEVVAGRVDLAVGAFSLTSNRVQAVDFTMPLMLTGSRIYLKQPSTSAVKLSQYFRAFDSRTWAVVMVFIVTAPILLTVIKRRGWIFWTEIIESYMQVWGIYCQQGLSEFPKESSVRLAFFSIFISALLVYLAYSASFISYLTVATVPLPFNTLEGFVNDGTYKLIVTANAVDLEFFMNTQDSFFRRFRPLMRREEELPHTVFEGCNQICAGRVGFYAAEALIDALSHPLPCKITSIGTGNVESLAMILNKNNPYTGLMDYYLQRFKDYGILNRLKTTKSSRAVPQENEHEAVTIWDIAPLFSVLAGGMILGCLLVLVERVVFWKLTKSEGARLYAQGTSGIFVTLKTPGVSMPVKGKDLTNCDELIMKSGYEMLGFGYWP